MVDKKLIRRELPMDKKLIIIPQLPIRMRYQEWWPNVLRRGLEPYFKEASLLLSGRSAAVEIDHALFGKGAFSDVEYSIDHEAAQILDYFESDVEDAVVLFCDMSFPGLVANVLFHRKPFKAFAFCHATSKNKYDYFQSDRNAKWLVECGHAKLFDKIFVASNYHKDKLGWNNVVTVPMPAPPLENRDFLKKEYRISSVARKCRQKRNESLERRVEKVLDEKIHTINAKSWEEYYHFLGQSEKLLITAQEETYGYQVIDAIKNGCVPIAPNNYSYPELLPKECLYNSFDDLCAKLQMKLPVPDYPDKENVDQCFEIWAKEMFE